MIEMTDPIEVLRDFRAEVPEPTAAEAGAALARLRETRSKRRRSRFVVVASLGAAAAAVAAAVVAAAPWDGAPQGPSATYKPGWIAHTSAVIHTVPYPGAGRYARLVEERWEATAAPLKRRSLGYEGFWTEKRVEIGAQSTSKGSDWFSYDPGTRTLYERHSDNPLTAAPNPQAYNRSRIESGSWKVAATVTIGGRKLLKVENAVPGNTYYLDADTYSLARIVGPGYPLNGPKVTPPCSFSGQQTSTVIDFKTEYLPPTDASLSLTDVRAQHAKAQVKPESAMPVGFRQIRYPPQCAQRPLQR
jgi:hypothetical protein